MAQPQVGMRAQQPHELANAVAGPSGGLAHGLKKRRTIELSSDSEDWGTEFLDEHLLQLAEGAPPAKRRKTDAQAHAGEPVAGPAPRWPAPKDDFDEACTTILSILPDVDLAHVKRLFLIQTAFGPANVEAMLEDLFTMDGGYPKAPQEEKRLDRKGKGKAKEVAVAGGLVDDAERRQQQEDEEVDKRGKLWLDLAERKPLGKSYEDAALAQLYIDFPRVQQHNMKRMFLAASSFYAPTYLAATKALRQSADERGWKLMVAPRADKGKNKADPQAELEKEIKWVKEELHKYRDVQERVKLRQLKLEEEIASGAFFECGCCFTDTAFSQIVTCTEGCAFCFDCARLNAESQIGMRKHVLPCMSTDGCTAFFPDTEMTKCLSIKTLETLHKIKQEKEIDAAELEGLEKCPFCPFAMIIESPDERLFHCQREECRVVSCRQCKKKDHIPKTCAEVNEDAKLHSVHQVEEAMSAALIRRCPKPGCGEPYIKEQGCNKITCSNCRTLSCYICGKIIAGYQHFRNAGTNLPVGMQSEVGSTCDLWDSTEERNRQEVEAARIAAEIELRKRNLHIAEEDLAKLKMGDKVPAAPANIAHLPAPRVAAYEAALEAYRQVAGGANNANAVAGPAAVAAQPVPARAVQPIKKPKVKKRAPADPPPVPHVPAYNPALPHVPGAPRLPLVKPPAARDQVQEAGAGVPEALKRAKQARKQVEDAREARWARTQGKK
ncbi:zinc finger, C6HC-type protein [Rhodotorula toruloides]|uniref:Zinc finger, C6HC-type protein n=1 Tax=Rhodotorula toruloides TaxID=5286 RepID=A0A511KJI3_RHOTO|nr:zinc finger, C6HC-type protein [Rhodotorula toruloides]